MTDAVSVAAPKPAFVRTLEARSPEEAERQLAQVFGSRAKVDYFSGRTGFLMRTRAVTLGDVQLEQRESENRRLKIPAGASVSVLVPLGGSGSGGREGDVREVPCSRSGVIGRPFATHYSNVRRGHCVSLSFSVQALERRFERLTDGATFNSDRIADRFDLNSEAGRCLSRHMLSALNQAISLDSLGLGPVAASAYDDILLSLAAVAVMPDLARKLETKPADCGSRMVKKVQDYLREHSAEPIELSAVAQQFGVGLRALQQNFRRYADASPREYLLERRLEAARRRLQSPPLGETLSRVAAGCGFSDVKHFARRYFEKFGQQPSETLRESLRNMYGA